MIWRQWGELAVESFSVGVPRCLLEVSGKRYTMLVQTIVLPLDVADCHSS